jgi:hypothetical protein
LEAWRSYKISSVSALYAGKSVTGEGEVKEVRRARKIKPNTDGERN